MVLHGFEVTDPIRNFSDYGFTMCSTSAGINQSIWEALGLRHQFWDICNHTVGAVEYDGKFHMVDNAFSNLVTNEDGVTLASVEEAGANSASLVLSHSLYSTSPNGFLSGSDTARPLSAYATAFCSHGLKRRDYYYNWSSGHRYVLNMRDDESYTRYYRRLGTTREYWVGSESVKSPDPNVTNEIDPANNFGVRGNGSWSFSPKLTAAAWASAAYSAINIRAAASGGLRPDVPGQISRVVYKVQAANPITSQKIRAQFSRTDARATATIAISLDQSRTWTDVADVGSTVGTAVDIAADLRDALNGAYEMLVRIQMTTTAAAPQGVILKSLQIDTLTQLNAHALPQLNLGRNEIYVGAGDQSDTMVLWPDLRGDLWKKDAYASQNLASQPIPLNRIYTAVVFPAVLMQDAYLVYRMDAPTDITRLVYGGRLYNYRAGSYIDFLHSFDGGTTWILSCRFADVSAPWDAIHYETVTNVPQGVRSVLFKFLFHNTAIEPTHVTGLYSVRMEVNHQPIVTGSKPVEVTFRWKEIGADRTLVERAHKQLITALPSRYVINVGGSDHPVMESMKLNLEGSGDSAPLGYSDGLDTGGQKYIYRQQVVGTNYAVGKPYQFSRPPTGWQGSANATNTTVLTDGVVGAPETGGKSYWWGQCWGSGLDVDFQIDLGQPRTLGAFRAHLFGWPPWDALRGEVKDRVEIQTSTNGSAFISQGTLETSLWRKDIPINHMLMDKETTASAWNFELLLTTPVTARYVRYHVTPKRIVCLSELQALDRIDYQPFDIRIAMPAAP
jgi:hypothetical protein